MSDVSFDVARGEIVVILGENGAGKTTILKIVADLARPDVGIVNARGRVAYAGGERAFYFRLTTRDATLAHY